MTCKHVVNTTTNGHGGVTFTGTVPMWSCPWCEIERLRRIVWGMQMHVAVPAPCRICGYKGRGFWQPETHECARKYSAEPTSDGNG